MTLPSFDLKTIEQWAFTADIDCEMYQYEEADPDWFEIAVCNACDIKDIFRFAADSKCLKRRFFAQLLVQDLCWIYRTDAGLPFHFSRLQGLISRTDYVLQVTRYAEAIYDRAEIIEQMRLSDDSALQYLAKVLLDYRHEKLDTRQREYVDLLRAVHSHVLPLFAGA